MPDIIIDGPTITRSQLYELVWRHDTKALAARCGIAGSLIGRVCKRWNIPKPARGYWQQVEVGQAIERPALPSWPGPDPVALRQSGKGYGTVVPPKVRASRAKKPDALDEYFRQQQEKRDQEAAERQREQDQLLELIDGPPTRHVLIIEDWGFDYSIGTELHPALAFGDDQVARLRGRYVLPERRRGTAMRLEVRFRWARGDGASGEISTTLGEVRFGKRAIDLSLAADTAGSICAALAAGKIKALDLDVVRHDGRDAIRWARLCTRTHDGAEDGDLGSLETGKNLG